MPVGPETSGVVEAGRAVSAAPAVAPVDPSVARSWLLVPGSADGLGLRPWVRIADVASDHWDADVALLRDCGSDLPRIARAEALLGAAEVFGLDAGAAGRRRSDYA